MSTLKLERVVFALTNQEGNN